MVGALATGSCTREGYALRDGMYCLISMSTTLPWPSQVRSQIPYMARFERDWATAKITCGYAAHLRSQARKNKELDPDHHYDYLKANSAKRRPDARRGTRPGLAKSSGRVGTNNDEGQDLGPSRAGPSSLQTMNTTPDEEIMNMPGMFGSKNPTDDENESDLDGDPDFGGLD